MLDKTEYYHGAAVVRLIRDKHCVSVRKRDNLGYVVNDRSFVLLKYTTKSRSPWGFTFDQEDVDRCVKMAEEYNSVYVGLVCASDGICALTWHEIDELLKGKAGRIAVDRKHNKSYSVWGTAGELKRKVSVNRWPGLMFEATEEETSPVVVFQNENEYAN